MREIYNEGRVVGLSSYELYVRQQLSSDSSFDCPSEREWLAATVNSGTSMILKVPRGTAKGIKSFPLPSNSKLCSCSTISAFSFLGNAEIGQGGWATKVLDYGPLILNNSQQGPATPGYPANVPYRDTEDDDLIPCYEFTKILSGLAFSSGEWTDYDEPAKEFTPDLNGKSFIRLEFSQDIENDFLILLAGFQYRDIAAGTTGFESCMDTPHPQDGDFLGPVSYPWACKINIVATREVLEAAEKYKLVRTIREEASKKVSTSSVIDLESAYSASFYNDSDYVVEGSASCISRSGDSVLAVVNQTTSSSSFAPTLYSYKVEEVGDIKLYPVDVAAPGTVKVVDSESDATSYPAMFHKSYSMLCNPDTSHVFLYKYDNTTGVGENVANLSSSLSVTNADSNPFVEITSGDDVATTISLYKPDGTAYNYNPTTDTPITGDYISWRELLDALSQERRVDLLGDNLRIVKNNTSSTLNITNVKLNPKGVSENCIRLGMDHTTTSHPNGVGLWISTSGSAPTSSAIKTGDIGIGW